MDLQTVVDRVKEVSDHSRNDEYAHELEDDLYKEVLSAIANGAENPSGLAREVLKTKDLAFSRWYA